MDLRGDSGDDVLLGSDSVSGGPGDDLLRGGIGDDLLAPGPGDDRVDGRAGTDTLILIPTALGADALTDQVRRLAALGGGYLQ